MTLETPKLRIYLIITPQCAFMKHPWTLFFVLMHVFMVLTVVLWMFISRCGGLQGFIQQTNVYHCITYNVHIKVSNKWKYFHLKVMIASLFSVLSYSVCFGNKSLMAPSLWNLSNFRNTDIPVWLSANLSFSNFMQSCVLGLLEVVVVQSVRFSPSYRE